MSSFTFLHAADLHLGSPLAGLSGRNVELAERFVAAGRDAFISLIDHAIETKAAFLLVAGDVFDGEWSDLSIGLFFARELARLERAGIPFAFVRGNHDAQSVVRKNVTLPSSVLEFPSNKAHTHHLTELRVALHGRSFPERTVPDDFVRSYPEPVEGWFNIGLLHTSIDGHPNHATYAPCSINDLKAKNYNYWALGHVHDFIEVSKDPAIVYPGNLQGRSIKECGSKGAVAIDVVDGNVSAIRHLSFDKARFAHVELEIESAETEGDIFDMVTAALRPHVEAGERRPIAVRITLRGQSELHDALNGDAERLEAELQAAAHRVHEDVWLERVRVRTTRPGADVAPKMGNLSAGPLLQNLDQDPAFRRRCLEVIAEIKTKLPAGMSDDDDLTDLDQLLCEAEAAVTARLTGRGC